MSISTHVLDTSLGKPAEGVPVRLEQLQSDGSWKLLTSGSTNVDGRVTDFFPQARSQELLPEPATVRLTFDTEAYFKTCDIQGFYPDVSVVCSILDPRQHYHIPLLLSPYGYSTYRGS